ncbi:DNA translocase FtsK [Snodgrassella sp. CFCC 13594]|uniref:DNA translocase FtsK n=1 Tax=Snodgrassella sp. CFCC 13594 TaxID=1775559 RepID=UPI0009EE6E37|nr:DNA translocase FtsK [Snodgrassella sp. CFCC 13594]
MKSTNKKAPIRKNSKPAANVKRSERSHAPQVMNLLNDAFWLLALMLTVYVTLSLASFTMDDPAWSRGIVSDEKPHNLGGIFGSYVADIAYYVFGLSAWWLVIATVVCLYKSFRPLQSKNDDAKPYNMVLGTVGLLLLLAFSPVLETYIWPTQLVNSLPTGAGGMVGHFAGHGLSSLLGLSGSLLLILVVMLVGLSLLIQVSWLTLIEQAGAQLEWLWYKLIRKPQRFLTDLPNARTVRRMVKQAKAITSEKADPLPAASSNRKAVPVRTAPEVQRDLFDEPTQRKTTKPDGTGAAEPGLIRLPELSLLTPPAQEMPVINPEQLQITAERIEAKLKEFGVEVEVTSATAGPVITRYEIEPAQGVKGSQIVNLAKDLARALSVQSVRVVETIAGKSTMGIELPNEHRQNVLLSEILTANVFQQASDKLTVAMGKDIAGIPVVANLAKMPHLLVAGTTGSGKSVGVNGMIASILYKAQPDEVRFIMVDPKMLELSVYEGIPHLLAPVVTDMREAAQALNWCVAEMEKRYRLLAHVGVRNLAGYNDKVADAKTRSEPLVNPFSLNPDEPEPLDKLPFIVVVIDELADLMMVEGKKVEQQIARLAQKARAAGIHLILATQRPSVDVITGLIKANIPTRISFQVSSKIDSRTILDQMGAENLLGKGDMLFLPPGQAEPTRLHGAFVSDEEVHAIVSYIKRQAPANYVDGLLSGEAAQDTENRVNPNANSDELFDQAVSFVLETRKTSISSLQRHLRIGYNRAANLMEALEAAGIVSPAELGGSRRILARKDELG